MKAKPATFVKVPSNPFVLATPASPIAELLAQGFTNKCEAPAEPERSSFPAFATELLIIAPHKMTFFIVIIEFFILYNSINKIKYRVNLSDAFLQRI